MAGDRIPVKPSWLLVPSLEPNIHRTGTQPGLDKAGGTPGLELPHRAQHCPPAREGGSRTHRLPHTFVRPWRFMTLKATGDVQGQLLVQGGRVQWEKPLWVMVGVAEDPAKQQVGVERRKGT